MTSYLAFLAISARRNFEPMEGIGVGVLDSGQIVVADRRRRIRVKIHGIRLPTGPRLHGEALHLLKRLCVGQDLIVFTRSKMGTKLVDADVELDTDRVVPSLATRHQELHYLNFVMVFKGLAVPDESSFIEGSLGDEDLANALDLAKADHAGIWSKGAKILERSNGSSLRHASVLRG